MVAPVSKWNWPMVVLLLGGFAVASTLFTGVSAATFKITAILPLSDPSSVATASGIRDALVAAQGIVDQVALGSNHSFALDVKDSASNATIAIKAVFDAAKDGAVAIIGEMGSAVTIPIALTTSNFAMLTCSGSVTTPDLAASKGFPLFIRTIPDDAAQGQFLARFVAMMQWRSVAVLYSSDAYGVGLMSMFQDEADAQRLQVTTIQSFSSTDHNGHELALEAIKESGTRVIVYFGLSADLIHVARDARDLGMIGADWVWIGADGISDLPEVLATATAADVDNCNGVLFSLPNQQGGAQYPAFWSTFHAAYPNRTDMPQYATLFVDCYQALARGIVRLAAIHGADKVLKRSYPPSFSASDVIMPFEGISGPVTWNADGGRLADFTIHNLWHGKAATVYSYPPGATALKSTGTAVRFYDGSSMVPPDRPAQLIAYVQWTSVGGIVIEAVTAVLIAVVVATTGYLFSRRMDPKVKSMSFVFLVQIAVGIVLVLVSVLVGLDEPTKLTCNLQTWLFLIGLALVLSAIAAKSFRLWRVFDNYKLEKLHHLSDTRLLLSCLAVAGIQALILVLWTVIAPLEPAMTSTATSVSYKCISNKSGWSIAFHVLALLYNAILLVSVLVLAFKTRKAFSAFRDSKYIGYACQNLFVIAVITIPLRYLAPDSIALTSYIIRTVLVLYASAFTFATLVGRVAMVPFLAARQPDPATHPMWERPGSRWSSSDGLASAAEPVVGKPTTMSGKYPVKKGNSLFAPWRTHRLTLFALEGWLALSRLTRDCEQGRLFKLRSVTFDPNPGSAGNSTTCIELRCDSTSYLVQCASEDDKARWVRALATHCPMYSRATGSNPGARLMDDPAAAVFAHTMSALARGGAESAVVVALPALIPHEHEDAPLMIGGVAATGASVGPTDGKSRDASVMASNGGSAGSEGGKSVRWSQFEDTIVDRSGGGGGKS
ncbi:hypothetical protein AMAG_15865 [Allomyces macrogynus ATCC 38327]|uniref:G-protein coupled receptors family 3 profile domain-containing protein n=1 Tax=Allomyces macrogynus (strain ATCC 38327) TaxID=578462 RepID=A0A0L0T8S2_ALLM3|nr:hypothetical protein, variant [Allomyces macrogynus ATCC 38327]KNE71209.1 hypothetical protein AMAG_15865 [Allomyces macrogynus ATCC 38327]|eukprot:KNE71208.1 hypothetical protein, variant [Allomyces macrogynus ATCC 38327]